MDQLRITLASAFEPSKPPFSVCEAIRSVILEEARSAGASDHQNFNNLAHHFRQAAEALGQAHAHLWGDPWTAFWEVAKSDPEMAVLAVGLLIRASDIKANHVALKIIFEPFLEADRELLMGILELAAGSTSKSAFAAVFVLPLLSTSPLLRAEGLDLSSLSIPTRHCVLSLYLVAQIHSASSTGAQPLLAWLAAAQKWVLPNQEGQDSLDHRALKQPLLPVPGALSLRASDVPVLASLVEQLSAGPATGFQSSTLAFDVLRNLLRTPTVQVGAGPAGAEWAEVLHLTARLPSLESRAWTQLLTVLSDRDPWAALSVALQRRSAHGLSPKALHAFRSFPSLGSICDEWGPHAANPLVPSPLLPNTSLLAAVKTLAIHPQRESLMEELCSSLEELLSALETSSVAAVARRIVWASCIMEAGVVDHFASRQDLRGRFPQCEAALCVAQGLLGASTLGPEQLICLQTPEATAMLRHLLLATDPQGTGRLLLDLSLARAAQIKPPQHQLLLLGLIARHLRRDQANSWILNYAGHPAGQLADSALSQLIEDALKTDMAQGVWPQDLVTGLIASALLSLENSLDGERMRMLFADRSKAVAVLQRLLGLIEMGHEPRNFVFLFIQLLPRARDEQISFAMGPQAQRLHNAQHGLFSCAPATRAARRGWVRARDELFDSICTEGEPPTQRRRLELVTPAPQQAAQNRRRGPSSASQSLSYLLALSSAEEAAESHHRNFQDF
jgi:hypothetical protein